nr:hypothetical protein [Tanacetum cinerariifolium]
MKSSTTNVETSNVEVPSNEEEVFHENSESFQEGSSSSSLKDDVQQLTLMQNSELPSSRIITEDPYEAIRQAYLVGTDTESEPFEDPVETETPDSPTLSSLTHTTPVLVPSLRRTARMAMRVSLAMSPGLSTSISEVPAMFDLAFPKRFRSSYDSSPSPTFPVRKRYRGTSELILDTDSEEDEEVEESLDSDSEIEDAKDEGLTAGEEGPTAGDEGFAAGDEGPGMGVESPSLGVDEAVPGGQQRASPVVETHVGEPLGLGYGALRRREIASREGKMPSVFEVGQGFGSVQKTKRPEGVSALRQPTLTTWIDLEDASPATAGAEGFLAELGAQVEIQGGLICDHTVRLEELSPSLFERYDKDIGELFTRSGAVRNEIFSQRYRFRSLEHEYERTIVMFGALWRYVMALEAWAGRVDTRMIDMSRAEYDVHRLVHDMLLQQAALQRELQEMRGRVTALEQERDRRERFLMKAEKFTLVDYFAKNGYGLIGSLMEF